MTTSILSSVLKIKTSSLAQIDVQSRAVWSSGIKAAYQLKQTIVKPANVINPHINLFWLHYIVYCYLQCTDECPKLLDERLAVNTDWQSSQATHKFVCGHVRQGNP